MTIRFFILQAHYRSTLDFGNEALIASKKGLDRLMSAFRQLDRIEPKADGKIDVSFAEDLKTKCYAAMDDDLNSPIVISHLFDACRTINTAADKKESFTPEGLEALRRVLHTFCFDILGLSVEENGNALREEAFAGAVDLLLNVRSKAKANKDWTTSDEIRDRLAELGFAVKDTKDGFTWNLDK